ncbi:hypothetical protein F4810DRAFT_707326 [Camillea tinctor]|nr:hypothetical protein F4810DRAFT_707326 [Camillea tinctor]
MGSAPVALGLPIQSNNDPTEYPEIFKHVNNYFTQNRRFEQGKMLGRGSFGGAFIFNELDANGEFLRKVVVKTSLDPWSDLATLNEIQHLTAVRGAEHIVRLLCSVPDVPGLDRAAFVMDYVEHGTWGDALARVRAVNQRIPNRMLWGIFLIAVARAVAGMAYPRGAEADAPPWREQIIDGQAPSLIAHNDMNLGNVVVGAWDRTDEEHRLCPITKLIDFGCADTLVPGEEAGGNLAAVRSNINDIGRVMRWLISGVPDFTIAPAIIGGGDPPRTIECRTHAGLDDPGLTDELRFLVRRCCATNAADVPSLREVLGACENAVRNHTAQDYAHLGPAAAVYERDAAVAYLVQMCILDAPLS